MKVYRAGWTRYQTFANQFEIASTPVTLEKVTLFIAYLGSQGLAVSTIEVYLAGIRYFRIQANPSCMAPSLHSPYINLIIKGIKRINSASVPTRARLPITATLMGRIKSSLSAKPHQWENLMVWAACCTGFFGFLCCAEFVTPDNTHFDPKVHLSISNLEYVHSDTQPYISLQIKASKTDQLRQGIMATLGGTKTEVCPVAAILDYLGTRGNTPGSLFINSDGSPLRRRQFVLSVQRALVQAGVNGELFNGHSFRIGAATSANQAGVPETMIKILSWWQSSAYQGYIRPSAPTLAAVSSRIVSAPKV